MSKHDSQIVHLTEDPDYFRAAVRFTAQVTAFTPRLIEKDYLCTVLLEYLSVASNELVFKGGTCLAKVHANFYRLSEDLDFVISMNTNVSRSERSKRAAKLKQAIAVLPKCLPFFRVLEPLKGVNKSMQYIATIGYMSLIHGEQDTIKIDVGLREPLHLPVLDSEAHTILLDPHSTQVLVQPFKVRCIAKTEAFAEKFRAALSRREVAIRDFYDLDYALRKLSLQPQDAEMVQLVRKKLAIPGNDSLNVSAQRLTELHQQLDSQLKPVLRDSDFREFDLDRAFKIVAEMAAKMA